MCVCPTCEFMVPCSNQEWVCILHIELLQLTANLEKKVQESAFDSWFWTGLLPFNDLYIDSNIWAAWNIPLFNLQ